MPIHRWHKSTQKFYQARIERDMFGFWSVQCTWGSLSTKRGNYKNYVFETIVDALKFVKTLSKRRLLRGYEPVGYIL